MKMPNLFFDFFQSKWRKSRFVRYTVTDQHVKQLRAGIEREPQPIEMCRIQLCNSSVDPWSRD